jgi:hypothetical protein
MDDLPGRDYGDHSSNVCPGFGLLVVLSPRYNSSLSIDTNGNGNTIRRD